MVTRNRPAQIRKLTATNTGTIPRTVLEVTGPWQEKWHELFEAKACDGLRWRWETRAKQADVGAVSDLAGLRYLELHIRGADDSPIADVPTLSELSINTDSRTPLDLRRLTSLQVLAVQRNALPMLSGLGISSIWISDWSEDHLDAPYLPLLETLRVEGARQEPTRFALRGLEQVKNVKTIWLDGLVPESFDAFSRLSELEELFIFGRGVLAEPVLDLTPLGSCPQLRRLDLWACAVESLNPVLNFPSLRQFSRPGSFKAGDFTEVSDFISMRAKRKS